MPARKTTKPGNYEIKAVCRNCGARNSVSIPKGTSVKDFMEKHTEALCMNCGITMAYQRSFLMGNP